MAVLELGVTKITVIAKHLGLSKDCVSGSVVAVRYREHSMVKAKLNNNRKTVNMDFEPYWQTNVIEKSLKENNDNPSLLWDIWIDRYNGKARKWIRKIIQKLRDDGRGIMVAKFKTAILKRESILRSQSAMEQIPQSTATAAKKETQNQRQQKSKSDGHRFE